MRKIKSKIRSLYATLYRHLGPQGWWPGETPFEIAVGAILTQNTSWQNVEKAIANLRAAGCLSFRALSEIPTRRLARLIKPAGYYNIKAKRLKNFLRYLGVVHQGSMRRMADGREAQLREELLTVNGIGEETADSILLYALSKPVFVVDAYTRRVCQRHRLIGEQADYGALQRLFTVSLPKRVKLFNEYHALLVRLGKEYCRKTKPKCLNCPVQGRI